MIHCRGGGSPPVLTFAFSIFISPCLCASVFNKKRITLIFCNPFLIRACLNFAQVNFANCFRGCFSDFMRRIAGYLTNKILLISCIAEQKIPRQPIGCRGEGKNGGYLLSRLRSTIGDAKLNCSVRNGKRWDLRAIAT